MSIFLQIVAIGLCVVMLYGLFSHMKHKRLSESQTILWLVGVLGLLILSCFPSILQWTAQVLGVWWEPAVLIFFLLVVVFFIVFYHTLTITALESQITELAMQTALLRDENREQMKCLQEMQNKIKELEEQRK